MAKEGKICQHFHSISAAHFPPKTPLTCGAYKGLHIRFHMASTQILTQVFILLYNLKTLDYSFIFLPISHSLPAAYMPKENTRKILSSLHKTEANHTQKLLHQLTFDYEDKIGKITLKPTLLPRFLQASNTNTYSYKVCEDFGQEVSEQGRTETSNSLKFKSSSILGKFGYGSYLFLRSLPIFQEF